VVLKQLQHVKNEVGKLWVWVEGEIPLDTGKAESEVSGDGFELVPLVVIEAGWTWSENVRSGIGGNESSFGKKLLWYPSRGKGISYSNIDGQISISNGEYGVVHVERSMFQSVGNDGGLSTFFVNEGCWDARLPALKEIP